MGKAMSGLTMSLDGSIAAPHEGPEHPLGECGMRLLDWYSSGDTEYVVPSGEITFKVSKQSAETLREAFSSIGAIWFSQNPSRFLRAIAMNHDADAVQAR